MVGRGLDTNTFGRLDSTNRYDGWRSDVYLGMNYQIVNVIFEYFQSECAESFLRFFLFSKQKKIKCAKRSFRDDIKKKEKNILLFSIRCEIGYYKNNFRFNKELFVLSRIENEIPTSYF